MNFENLSYLEINYRKFSGILKTYRKFPKIKKDYHKFLIILEIYHRPNVFFLQDADLIAERSFVNRIWYSARFPKL